jgi:AcrR family transcriptional regulator
VARWEPNARERLEKAALDLYGERGFAETAVADIAARAGLTERTFFRHFTDKREVLFGGSAALKTGLADVIGKAPPAAAPLDAVAAALEATSEFFNQRREYARSRHAVIAANAELQERELIKLTSLSTGMAEALRRRGVTEPSASLAAEAGTAIFKLAFERWVHDPKQKDFAHHVRECLSTLKAVAAASGAETVAPSRPVRSRTRRTAG